MNRFIKAIAVLTLITQCLAGQEISRLDRERAQTMWTNISSDLRKHYYDSSFHGINFDAKFRETRDAINKSTSLNRAFSEIATALDSFGDSHLYFVPPSRPYRLDFGWRLKMIGDRCFIANVRPHGNADSKELHAGDEVLSINGYRPTRTTLWKMLYVFNLIRPQPSLQIVVRNSAGQERGVEVLAKVQQMKKVTDLSFSGGGQDIWEQVRQYESGIHSLRIRTAEVGPKLLIAKIPAFEFTSTQVDDLLKKAAKHESLVLDLRDNPGGDVVALKNLVSALFEKDVRIAHRVGRKVDTVVIANGLGTRAFSGKLFVLVDSGSGSASEVFARVIELEKRGIVLGDVTAGAVMEAIYHPYELGPDPVILYGASITDADLLMSDGKSLEKVGVRPDEIVVPTASDIFANRDPVLARAAELAGTNLTAEDAGKLFPFEWPPN